MAVKFFLAKSYKIDRKQNFIELHWILSAFGLQDDGVQHLTQTQEVNHYGK
jgi:hypothetical protein